MRKNYTHPALDKIDYLADENFAAGSGTTPTPEIGDMGSGDDSGGPAW